MTDDELDRVERDARTSHEPIPAATVLALVAELRAAKRLLYEIADAPLRLEIATQRFAARAAELEAALRPFSLLAVDNPETPGGVPIRFWDEKEPDRPAVEPTMADCRRAAALLEPGGGEGETD